MVDVLKFRFFPHTCLAKIMFSKQFFHKILSGMATRGVEGGVVTSYIRHSTDVRAEWPPFSALQGI